MSTKRTLDRILSQIPATSFAVGFWDGETRHYGPGPAEFVLHLRDEAVCRRLLGNLHLRFGEAYVAGAIEVDGDLGRLLRLMFVVRPEAFALSLGEKAKIALASRWPRDPLRDAKHKVAPHYDLGNEFFKLWLGKEMVYSCAYFAHPDEDIDTAQARKFRHIAGKLRLRPGARLLDIGCGWGGFLLHAAAHHGVQGLGVTLSRAQQEEGSRRLAAHGVADRVTVAVKDYREIGDDAGFDRVVSIGMFEHVGRRRYPEYFRHTTRLLKPGGVGVLHTIGRQVEAPANPWVTRYIFPGAHFPSLAEITVPLTASGLVVTDVEVWRLHYALTLERWLDAYEASVDRVRAMYGEPFTRMWRLYLAGCAASFRHGDFCVWQIQFTRGPSDVVPLTRDYLSAAEP